MKSFETLNAGKPYAEQIKPFNFLLTAHVIPFGHSEGIDSEKFHLITPYDSDPRKWLKKEPREIIELRAGRSKDTQDAGIARERSQKAQTGLT